jgi:hypothetical protein
VNLLRWGQAATALDAGEDPAQTGPDSGLHCRIERWDFGSSEQAFRPASVSFIEPERASRYLENSSIHSKL